MTKAQINGKKKRTLTLLSLYGAMCVLTDGYRTGEGLDIGVGVLLCICGSETSFRCA